MSDPYMTNNVHVYYIGTGAYTQCPTAQKNRCVNCLLCISFSELFYPYISETVSKSIREAPM